MPTKISTKNARFEFASYPKMGLDLVSPKNLLVIAGRATGKTADILAERSMKVIRDMPGAYIAWVAATYEDAHRNILPVLLEGWTRKGWMEGRDYVVDIKPPDSWKKAYKRPLTYKHTICFTNGTIMIIGSLDQPSSLAGNSYQHIFGDEAKHLDFSKLKKLMPAIRGEYVRFCHSIYYRGVSFTTDMPDILDKEHDWILNWEKEMDQERCELALQVGLVLNGIKRDIKKESERGNNTAVNKLLGSLKRWTIDWTRARKDLTLFYTTSSYTNARVLSVDYFKDSLVALGPTEFMKSVVSLKPILNKGESFYPTLGEHHFFNNGIVDGYYEKFSLKEEIKYSWKALKFLDKNLPLEIGLDFGNQCSMVIGQRRGNYYYVLKEFYSLAPDDLEDMCKDFLAFFAGFPTQVIRAYYDRSGNQNRATKRDYATWLSESLTKADNHITGWRVELMSRGQATIGQDAEYLFMKRLYGGYNSKMPKILIDKLMCPYFATSIQATRTSSRKDKNGVSHITKDKSSEKTLKGIALVKYSTNFSDAGKYLFMRKEWQRIMNDKEIVLADPDFVGN